MLRLGWLPRLGQCWDPTFEIPPSPLMGWGADGGHCDPLLAFLSGSFPGSLSGTYLASLLCASLSPSLSSLSPVSLSVPASPLCLSLFPALSCLPVSLITTTYSFYPSISVSFLYHLSSPSPSFFCLLLYFFSVPLCFLLTLSPVSALLPLSASQLERGIERRDRQRQKGRETETVSPSLPSLSPSCLHFFPFCLSLSPVSLSFLSFVLLSLSHLCLCLCLLPLSFSLFLFLQIAIPLETPSLSSARLPGTLRHAWATRHQVEAQGEEEEKEDAEDAEDAAATSLLAGDRLNLDLYPGGCGLLLRLLREPASPLQHIQFLRLNCNEKQIGAALAALPNLRALRSLVLRGGHHRDDWGLCLRGSLTTLPPCLSDLASLVHLDLSFNSLRLLPACIPQMTRLDALLLSHNLLERLPEALGTLRALTFLSVSSNRLQALPAGLAGLTALQRLDLSENCLEVLPEEIGALSSLTELNLASNYLHSLPDSLASLQSLRLLLLPSNLLVSIPPGLARLPLLTQLDLRDNRLRAVPPEIQEACFVQLQGNPLGVPEPIPTVPPGEAPAPEVPKVLLASDADSFTVTSHGCSVALDCGVRMLFPPGATMAPTTVRYRQLPPEPHLVWLGPHDALLSAVLELQPHGTPFQQRFWASCRVPHFSWFLVVSRPVEDSCFVPREGALLCSSGDPGVKVIFPAGVTTEPRHVRIQVVRVSGWALGEDTEATVSPLLCLAQDNPCDFLGPVTIQLPLPPGITGLSLDRTRLHLLHGDPQVLAWDDITARVALELTHLYARFQVTHFSWYWLWYTTKSCVEGLARKVYDRLRLYRVNFIALQRRRDPEQVLLQCLPGKKVEPTLKKLQPRYRGPEPSDTVELFEGEQFFAAFERGIDIDAERPDCVAGRIAFVFYSRLKNMKEIYVTSTVDRKMQAVKGQVSFYRGAMPEAVPVEAAQRRKGPDALWLATLPIKLPRLPQGEGKGPLDGLSLASLNLGDPESGFLTQSNLLTVASRLGPDWQSVALHLGLSYPEVQRIQYAYRDDLDGQVRHMLFSWAERQTGQPGSVQQLLEALEQSDRQDVVEEVQAILELGRNKYQASIRRVGLASEEDSPSATA
ncbi:p53-induced death domain-containing protein 1 isoform X2 [Notamacropus eugenii]|uniref:p53-induced death domain-containing protein 1 isoform X2 n=1 Tax=Notamacropus eugenii TaxID=9315 RepID=UPI003B681ECC